MSVQPVKDEAMEGVRMGIPHPQQQILTAPLAIRTSRSQVFPPGWDAPSTPLASPSRLPPITTAPPSYALSYTQTNHSPFPSPVASSSSSFSGFATTPSSEVSTSTSMSSYASDKRIFMPMEPAPVCLPYSGFYSQAIDNEPHQFAAQVHGNGDVPLASAPISGREHPRANGYFELGPSLYEEPSLLQQAIANFERLFGNWRMWIDGGRASDPGAAQLRAQMETAFMRMMDAAREKEAHYARDGRKRHNSITSTPNPAPIKLRREDSISVKPPPLVHAHTSPIVPLAATTATSPTLPAFISKASSATPAAQAMVDGVHFNTTTGSPILPSPVVPHTPHTPSPLSAGIMAPVLQQAETQLNSALANGLPTSISAPASPRLRSELAQAFYDPAANAPTPAASRQPPNPRSVGGGHSRQTSEAGSSGPGSASPLTLPRGAMVMNWSSSSLASQDESDDALITPSGSPREVHDEAEEDDDTMSVDQPPHKKGPFLSTGVAAAEPVAIEPDVKAGLDNAMVDFLNKLCNDYDYTDAKGELVHQRLMASKMEKLTEAGDYRPFKFRIQAFTNAFGDDVTAAGYDAKDITYKLLRQYLWQHPLISRFNEDGKKAKSKGNHIWTIEARRDDEGRWHFRDFPRRIILPAAKPLQPGLDWSWQPRIWDPQGVQHQATFEASPLPSWLSWNAKRHEYSGTVPRDAHGQYGPVEVVAKYDFGGAPQELRASFTLSSTPEEKASRSRAASSAAKPNDSLTATIPPTPSPAVTNAASQSKATTQPNSPEATTFPHLQQAFDLGPSPVLLGGLMSSVPQPPFPDPMLTEPLQGTMTDLVSYLPSELNPLQPASTSSLSPLHQMAAGTSLLTSSPMSALGIGPSALATAALTSEPSLGDLLAPINLLKEEMSVTEHRPGPIESAVMRHTEMQQTLAAGPPPALARVALDQLNEAQHQVSQAVSTAQGNKLHNLMSIDVTQSTMQPAVLTGTLAPPPTPVVGIDPASTGLSFMA